MNSISSTVSIVQIEKKLCEMSNCVAAYDNLIRHLGTYQDSPELRFKMKFFKCRLLTNAQLTSDALLVYHQLLRTGTIPNIQNMSDLIREKDIVERYQAFVIALLEYLILRLKRANCIVESSCSLNLVNCGFSLHEKSHFRIHTKDPAHKKVQITSDIEALHNMISNIYRFGGLSPWSIQPDSDYFTENFKAISRMRIKTMNKERKNTLINFNQMKRASINYLTDGLKLLNTGAKEFIDTMRTTLSEHNLNGASEDELLSCRSSFSVTSSYKEENEVSINSNEDNMDEIEEIECSSKPLDKNIQRNSLQIRTTIINEEIQSDGSCCHKLLFLI